MLKHNIFTRENNMLFLQMKRFPLLPYIIPYICCCMIETLSVLSWKSLENVQKHSSGLRTTFEESPEISGKCSEVFGKLSKTSSLDSMFV